MANKKLNFPCFTHKDDDRSIIESEYNAAGHLPRFIYFVNEDALWSPKFIDQGDDARKLCKFKERLKETHICKYFSNKDELATSVAADLGRHFLRNTLVSIDDSLYKESARKKKQGTWSSVEWNEYRQGKYKSNRNLFLVHTLAPSNRKGQWFDIFIYLQRHHTTDFSDILFAEFFMGPYWNDRIFTVENKGDTIGITTSAYGKVLYVCKVTFYDGSILFLDRYINFDEYARK